MATVSDSIPQEAQAEDAAGRWSIVFLVSGALLPAMLDLAYFAQKSGLKTLMIVLERQELTLKPDRALVNYDMITVNVPYTAVEFRRFTSMLSVYRKLKTIIIEGLEPNGTIITSSYDLLMMSRLIALGRKYRLKHQVRDLHPLQLSKSFLSYCFVLIERLLLKRVEQVLVSSPEFANQYYRNIFHGKTVLLENMPARQTWAGFKKDRTDPGCFRIGYIGIIRYKESLKQLIAAVQILAREGRRIKVVFAGGGRFDDLLEVIGDKTLFEFQGAYEYSKDIKRLYSNIDLNYSVYDSHNLNCQLAMPNKFYESIISEIPILVASNTFLEKEVLRLGIGASVLSGDVDGLVDLLRKAIDNKDWYATALKRLQACDANDYFDAYDKALEESILG